MGDHWRIVLADGAVLRVETDRHAAGWDAWVEGRGCRLVPDAGAREPTEARALRRCVALWASYYDLREVVPPGEPTRAEAVAAEREACAQVCAAKALESLSKTVHDFDPHRVGTLIEAVREFVEDQEAEKTCSWCGADTDERHEINCWLRRFGMALEDLHA